MKTTMSMASVVLVLLAAGCDGAASPSAAGILFVLPVGPQQGPFPRGDVYLTDPDGANQERLTDLGDAAFAAWSYDGSRIAFTRLDDSTRPNVWTMNADGSGLAQLTRDGGIMPSWSPDGATIIFTHPDGGVYAVASDGTGAARQLRSNAYFGSFSPDGARIVYTGKVQGEDRLHNEIFTMDAGGSDPQQLTFTDFDPDYPDANAASWSPDGTSIAFFCGHEGDLPPEELGPYYEAGTQQVCVMNAADGSDRRVLTQCTRCGSDNPGWSPDGERVFFDRGNIDVGVSTGIIDVDGTHEETLLDVSYGGGRLPWR